MLTSTGQYCCNNNTTHQQTFSVIILGYLYFLDCLYKHL